MKCLKILAQDLFDLLSDSSLLGTKSTAGIIHPQRPTIHVSHMYNKDIDRFL